MNIRKFLSIAALTTVCIFSIGLQARAMPEGDSRSPFAVVYTKSFDIDIDTRTYTYVGCDKKKRCIKLDNAAVWNYGDKSGVVWKNGKYSYILFSENSNPSKEYLVVLLKNKQVIFEEVIHSYWR